LRVIKNLCKTWYQLDPGEVRYLSGPTLILWQYERGRHTKIDIHQLKHSCEMQDVLFGYIQRCIYARGWYFSTQRSHSYCKADVQISPREVSHQYGEENGDCYKVLLTAYLNCLLAAKE
jgi:hypothetical protein